MDQHAAQGIHVERRGSGEAHVLLLHGNSLGLHALTGLLEFTPSVPCSRVAVDLPGHGSSRRAQAPQDYGLAGLVRFVAGLVEGLGDAPIVLAGHSLGGHLALQVAPLLGERLRGILVWGTPPLESAATTGAFRPVPVFPHFYAEEVTRSEAEAMAAHVYDEPPAWAVDAILQTDGAFRVELGKSLARGEVRNERALLETASCPVAVLCGERDRLVELDYVRALRGERLWRGQAQIVPDGSHSCHAEQAGAFLPTFDAFLTDCLGSTR